MKLVCELNWNEFRFLVMNKGRPISKQRLDAEGTGKNYLERGESLCYNEVDIARFYVENATNEGLNPIVGYVRYLKDCYLMKRLPRFKMELLERTAWGL